MSFSRIAILIVTLRGNPVDELHSDPGIFSSNYPVGVCYRAALRDALLSDAPGNPVQLVAIPPFDPEFVVFAKAGQGPSPRVVVRRLRKNLWQAAFGRGVPGEASLNNIATCERFRRVAKEVDETSAPIDFDTFERLRQIWTTFIARAIQPTGVSGLRDPVQYYFGVCGERGCLSGIAESPPAGTRVARFVGVADLMADYAKAPSVARQQHHERIQIELDALIALLRKSAEPPTDSNRKSKQRTIEE